MRLKKLPEGTTLYTNSIYFWDLAMPYELQPLTQNTFQMTRNKWYSVKYLEDIQRWGTAFSQFYIIMDL